jgi:hypothetical protein
LDNAKYERPKKSFIEKKDCLDKDFKDKSPVIPQVPQKKPIKDYEKRVHVEKIVRKPKTIIPQSDNVFNFEPPEKYKNKKKAPEGQVPSNYYKKTENTKMYYNHYLDIKPPKNYNEKGRKDNLKDLFGKNLTEGNSYMDRPHKKVTYKNTEVNEIFEKGKNYIPVRYKEPTPNVEKDDYDQMAHSAFNNYNSIRKNGRKPLKRDF